MTDKKKEPSGRTKAVTAEIGSDPAFRSVTPPIYLSSTYQYPDVDKKGPYDYGRTANPTRDALARTLAKLEGGEHAIIAATGMAAINCCFNLVGVGERVIAPHDCYGGTHRLLTSRHRQGHFIVDFVDQSDETALDAAFARGAKLVLIETPSNPLMRLVDIAAIAARAKEVGAITMADNTFLSPARQQPLALGCEISVHSTTKYLNGHSDVVGGAIITKTKALGEELAWWANNTGVTGAPFDSYQTLRGLRTLHIRMDAQEASAQAIAEFLDAHPKVSRVYYPGLSSDPGFALAQKQQSGPGAMLSFDLQGGMEQADKFLKALSIFQMAPSLGGTESLACYPTTMTHAGMEPDAREKAGIGPGLIRLSVGLEETSDQIADLKTALTVF